MAAVKSFEELLIWQDALTLCKRIYAITAIGTFTTDFRFKDQIHASAGSIMDNIAEGFERNNNKEFVNFLYIAKGSCGEVRSQVIRAKEVGHISVDEYEALYNMCVALSRSINAFIYSLKARSSEDLRHKPIN